MRCIGARSGIAESIRGFLVVYGEQADELLRSLPPSADRTSRMGRQLTNRAFGAENVTAGSRHGGFCLERFETDDTDERRHGDKECEIGKGTKGSVGSNQ